MAFNRHEYMRNYMRDLHRRRRQEAIAALGGVCVRCTFSDGRALQIDHVHGGGVKELKGSRNPRRYYEHVLSSVTRGESRYQLLCANCNWIKRTENNENAHRPPHKEAEQTTTSVRPGRRSDKAKWAARYMKFRELNKHG